MRVTTVAGISTTLDSKIVVSGADGPRLRQHPITGASPALKGFRYDRRNTDFSGSLATVFAKLRCRNKFSCSPAPNNLESQFVTEELHDLETIEPPRLIGRRNFPFGATGKTIHRSSAAAIAIRNDLMNFIRQQERRCY